MPDREPTAVDHLEQARDAIWEAAQMLEGAQRILYDAGDLYVAQVWGNGVRNVIEITERITDVAGDLAAIHIEIGRLVRKDQGRGSEPPDGA